MADISRVLSSLVSSSIGRSTPTALKMNLAFEQMQSIEYSFGKTSLQTVKKSLDAIRELLTTIQKTVKSPNSGNQVIEREFQLLNLDFEYLVARVNFALGQESLLSSSSPLQPKQIKPAASAFSAGKRVPQVLPPARPTSRQPSWKEFSPSAPVSKTARRVSSVHTAQPSRAPAFVAPALQDPSPTFERDAWEADVPAVTGDQAVQSLNALAAEWKRNRLEQVEKRASGETPKEETQQPKDTKKALRESNEQIYAFVKKQTGVATPRDFLWSLRRVRILTDPIPIMGEGETFQPEEGQFYKLEPFNRDGVPVRKPGEQGDAVHSSIPFGQAIKRSNNRLELYLDTISCARSLYINGQFCSFPGKGTSQPCYIFKEGDVVCEAQRYLFTVGKNGTLIYPDTKRHSFPIGEEAASQTKTFIAQLVYKRNKGDPNHLRFTDNLQAAEIGIDEPIRPGFSFYSTLKTGRTNPSQEIDITHSQDDKGDLVFIDIHRDRILQNLVTYLKTEFALMNYTPEQKMMRLASISADLLSADVWMSRMEKNYLLGDVLQAGAGVCRHRALLIKTLADQLGMPCALVVGPVNRPIPLYAGGKFLGFMEMISIEGQPVAAHAWNIMHLNGRYWVVDAMQQQVFPVDEPPGESSEHRERISGWYGTKPLQQALALI